MPLTALDVSGATFDATACSDADWTSVYMCRPRAHLLCRGCGKMMHAKVSSKGLRFFAHDVLSEGCFSAGETPQHLALKVLIANLIRAAGGQAVLEATPAPTDQGGWRADVLGIGTEGRRVAFEVQLEAMKLEEGQERTARYRADGIDTVWVSDKHASWMCRLPSCHLSSVAEDALVDRGIARYRADPVHPWEPAEPVPLKSVVRGLLYGNMGTTKSGYYTERIAERTFTSDDAVVLVTTHDLQRQVAHEQRRERVKAKHAANLLALEQRQDRVLQLAIDDAIHEGNLTSISLGVPPTRWTGELPVPLKDASGNNATGFAPALWTEHEKGRNGLHLWAVICPPASHLSPSLGRSWRARNVRVYVESAAEARKVGQALEWPSQLLHIRRDIRQGH